jgi:MOSC domain-containing protein YiiM
MVSASAREPDNVPDVTIAQVIAVNTGRGRDADWAGALRRTAIDKRPAAGPVRVGRLGLDWDEQVDVANHGGPDQAVYAYAREDLDWWAGQLGRDLRNGIFGENVTTAGLEVTGALIGEVWRLGTALVQIASVRIPCVVFQNWMNEAHWVKRFAHARRPGAMLRVLEEGRVGVGDPVEVVSRPAESVTVAESMRAYYGDAALMRRLLQVEGRGAGWDEVALAVLGRAPAGEG